MTIRIGIQGGPGSFNEEAVAYYAASRNVTNCEVVYLYTTGAVLQAVTERRVDFGQFALYNNYAGPVEESIRILGLYQFRVEDWYSMTVAHSLMCHQDRDFSGIDTIMTHPHVFRQCRQNLRSRYPHLKLAQGEGELVDASSIAAALQNGILPSSVATVGCNSVAGLYGLRIIDADLQDNAGNATTFLLVSPPG